MSHPILSSNAESSKLLVQAPKTSLLIELLFLVLIGHREELEVEEFHLAVNHETLLLECRHLLLDLLHVGLLDLLQHELKDVNLQLQDIISTCDVAQLLLMVATLCTISLSARILLLVDP